MAQPRTYTVTLHPAKRTTYGVEVIFSLREDPPRLRFAATSIEDMLAQVEKFANEIGGGKTALVSLADGGRKPNGFDKAVNLLYYNL